MYIFAGISEMDLREPAQVANGAVLQFFATLQGVGRECGASAAGAHGALYGRAR